MSNFVYIALSCLLFWTGISCQNPQTEWCHGKIWISNFSSKCKSPGNRELSGGHSPSHPRLSPNHTLLPPTPWGQWVLTDFCGHSAHNPGSAGRTCPPSYRARLPLLSMWGVICLSFVTASSWHIAVSSWYTQLKPPSPLTKSPGSTYNGTSPPNLPIEGVDLKLILRKNGAVVILAEDKALHKRHSMWSSWS